MAFNRMILGMFAVLLLAGVSFAGCAYDAYAKACNSCSFDASGKIDQSCSSGYKSGGTACVSASYPIMAAKYAAGECPGVDACASELSSCSSQYASGNDKADCQEGSVGVCYKAADACVQSAAIKCGEVEKECGAPVGMILMALAGALFLSRK